MTHSKEEMEIIREFENSVDNTILEFVKRIYAGEQVRPITVGVIDEKTSLKIEKLTGERVGGNRIILDSNGAIHIKNRHGKDGVQDESMANVEDIARIGYVLSNYDKIDFNNEFAQGYVDGKGKLAPKIVISKKIDGTYYVVETVSDTKKHRNYIVSAYIMPRKKESDTSVPNNA